MVSQQTVKDAIASHPDYRLFWRSGFAYRGAKEGEVIKSEFPKEVFCHPYYDANGKWHNRKVMTFDEYMQKEYDWAAAIDMTIDDEKKEIHLNGFSANDMY